MPAAGAHRTPTYKTGVQRIYSDLAKLGIWDHISRGGHGDPTVSHAAPSGASASSLPQHRQHRQIHSPHAAILRLHYPGKERISRKGEGVRPCFPELKRRAAHARLR
jgi:hypothetical protein